MAYRDFIRQAGYTRWALRYPYFQIRKRLLGRDMRYRLPTGQDIILPVSHRVSDIFITEGDIDNGTESLFARHATQNRDFIDIGAHIGYYSNYISPLVRKVYAFEPDPRNISVLERNAALCRNVEVIKKAVSSEVGRAKLSLALGPTGNSLQPIEGAATLDVEVTTIDQFVADHPGIDVGLIKTDIEDHDIEALKGMNATVERFRPLIISELGYDPELPTLLQKWEYRLYAFVIDPRTMRSTFRSLTAEQLRDVWTKMIFLSPDEMPTDA